MKSSSVQFVRQSLQKYRESILLFCTAVWSCCAIVYLLTDTRVYAPLGLLFAPLLFSFFRQHRQNNQALRIRERTLCLLLAFCSAFALYFADDIPQRFNALFASVVSFALRFFFIAGTAILLYTIFCTICIFSLKETAERFLQPLSRKWFFIFWAIFFFVWFAIYLVCFYPGLFSPDTSAQLNIVEGTSPWSNHHPVLHTLLLWITMRLTGYRPVFYVLVQTLAVTALLAYTCVWLRKRPISKWLWYGILLFFLLHPIFSTNTFSFIKDILFSGAVLFFTLCVADFVLDEEKAKSHSGIVCLTVATLLVLFLRNNGFVVVLLTYAALWIFCRKQRGIAASIGGGSFLFYCIIQIIVLPTYGVAQTSMAESLGIPLQQMCSVIAEGKCYSDDIMQYLNRILPLQTIAEVFDPKVIDPIKFHKQFSISVIESDPLLFLRFWTRGLMQHPLEYVKSYLCLTQFLWDPMQKAGMIESVYISPHFSFFAPHPLIPVISSLYFSAINLMQNSRYAFLTRPFWNAAVFYTLSCLCAIAVLLKKHAKQLLIWIPAFAVWFSLAISTPIATCGRYVLSIFFCAPLFIALAMEQPAEHDG